MSEYKELIKEQKVMLIEAIKESFPEQTEDIKALRDYFAAAALQGLIALIRNEASSSVAITCDMAYKYADAMVKERERGREE